MSKLSLIACVVAVTYMLSVTANEAKANVFGDVWGVVTDPLGLRRASQTLSESVERSLIQLTALESVANNDVKARLEQIRSIVTDALSGQRALIDQAVLNMNQLEASINRDAVNLLYRAQCAAEVAATTTSQRLFASLISNLRKSDPRVVIAGITVGRVTADEVEITDPDQAYRSTKRAVLDKLGRAVSDSSAAYDILSTYQNLETGAKFARCHYLGQALDIRFVEEINDLERMSLPWTTIVEPRM